MPLQKNIWIAAVYCYIPTGVCWGRDWNI